MKKEDKLITKSLQLIKSRKGIMKVKDLVDHYNISERQFQRRFIATLGVSPKHYLTTTRFMEAVNLLKSGNYEKLSDIAYILNYSDQSHFIREVIKLSGMKPKQLQEKLKQGSGNIILKPEYYSC
ncbi:helix-turn-helix domain-containing protein [Bizionia paragorgiae]|uniref:helix-turn-helix domain-containing protein n=1 Tax=Bizionia paragorgiae TaxID=283786 RepID=UPI003A8F44FA